MVDAIDPETLAAAQAALMAPPAPAGPLTDFGTDAPQDPASFVPPPAPDAPMPDYGAPPAPTVGVPPLDDRFAPAPAAAPVGRDPVSFQREVPTGVADASAPAPVAVPQDPIAELIAMAPRPSTSAGAPGGNIGALRKDLATRQQATLGTYDQQAAATQDVAQIESQRAADAQQIQKATALKQEADAQVQYAENQRILASHDAYMQKTAQLVDDLARQKVDPGRLFTGSTGADVSFAIGALLSSFVVSPDGQNNGMKMINQAIDRNLRAQELEIDNKKGAIAARNTLYGQMRESFQDKHLADEAFRLAGLQAAENQMKSMMAGYDSKTALARGNVALAEIGREKDRLQESISASALQVAQQQAAAWGSAQRAAADKAFERAITVYKLRQEDKKIGQDDQKIQIEAQKAQAEGATKTATAAQKQAELFVPTGANGQGYVARTEQEARDQRGGRAAGQELLALIDRIRSQRADSGMLGRAASEGIANATGVETEGRARTTSLAGQIAASYKDYKKLGTWDNGSERLIESITGDPTAISGASDAKLDELRMNVLAGLARSALSQGQTQGGASGGFEATSATPPGFVERKAPR